MSDLNSNINSEHYKAEDALNNRNTIFIYVESESDISFWSSIFINKGINNIDVSPASKTSEKRGKQEVMKLVEEADVNLLLCVDSDYDYIFENTTDISKEINTNSFIFQTYSYSIENIKCNVNTLNDVVYESTKVENTIFSFSDFFTQYSELIFELFIYSIYDEKNKIGSFSINDLSKIITFGCNINIDKQGIDELVLLKDRVSEKKRNLDSLPNDFFYECEENLTKKGINRTNTYLFIKGHTLLDNIVTLILKPLQKRIKDIKYKEISKLDVSGVEKNKLRTQYADNIIDVIQVLQQNTNFENCSLIEKINSDIQKYKTLNS